MTEAAPPKRPMVSLPPTTANGSHHTRWFLLAFYGLAVVCGVRNIWYWEPSALDLLAPVVFAIILGWWVLVDARRRRHPIPVLARPWFFLMAGLAVPGYVIWSRRWRGLGWVVLNAVVWYAIASIIMHAGGYFVFGDEWLKAEGF